MELVYSYLNSYFLTILEKKYSDSLGQFKINFKEYVKSQFDFSYLCNRFRNRSFKVYFDCFKSIVENKPFNYDECIRYFYEDISNVYRSLSFQVNETNSYVDFKDVFVVDIDIDNIEVSVDDIISDYLSLINGNTQIKISKDLSNMSLSILELNPIINDDLISDKRVTKYLALFCFYFGLSKSENVKAVSLCGGDFNR